MAKKRNIIVGQSGGPTSVINSSLAGVYKTAKERGFHKVYGMLHGIQGFLDEQYVDLSTQIHSDMDIELLKRTPSAFLGSCRYKLPDIHENPDIYDKIFNILDKLDIETFIYIGGNDSMDTIKKLSDYAILKGYTQKFLGVPKTIDNLAEALQNDYHKVMFSEYQPELTDSDCNGKQYRNLIARYIAG